MSNSDLAAVEALLLRVLPDPTGFAQNILGELAERLGTDPAAARAPVVPTYEAQVHEALVDRNTLLAAALGACECWGEETGCPGCDGRGAAGWVPPDPELYAEYVAPAVRRTSDGPPDPPAVHPVHVASGEGEVG